MTKLCSGGAVGAAFSELQTTLLNVIKTISGFKSTLKRLEATILVVCPIFYQLKRGTDLILLCSKIKSWNLYKKNVYSKKLQSFNDLLIRFFQIDVQLHQLRCTRQISVGVSDLSDKLYSVKDEILNEVRLESIHFSSCSRSVGKYSGYSCIGELPELILGLDLPLEELKVLLLLSAPPG